MAEVNSRRREDEQHAQTLPDLMIRLAIFTILSEAPRGIDTR